jgi:adenylate cyclase
MYIMPIEIERKFLVTNDSWKMSARGIPFKQGYLSTDKERTVRVRIAGNQGLITIKGLSHGIARTEFEYDIPVADAQIMLDTLCIKPLIEKMRYTVMYNQLQWEVDEFLGDNQGLVVAEIELAAIDQQIDLPDWVGRDVSDDPRYFNSSLIAHPFRNW